MVPRRAHHRHLRGHRPDPAPDHRARHPGLWARRAEVVGARVGKARAHGASRLPELEFDATGERVYGTTFIPAALVVFARDPESGLLAHLETHPGEEIPGGIESGTSTRLDLSPDGRHLYVSADGEILIFATPEPGAAALGLAALATLAALARSGAGRSRA